jgi:hypothetical protein
MHSSGFSTATGAAAQYCFLLLQPDTTNYCYTAIMLYHMTLLVYMCTHYYHYIRGLWTVDVWLLDEPF